VWLAGWLAGWLVQCVAAARAAAAAGGRAGRDWPLPVGVDWLDGLAIDGKTIGHSAVPDGGIDVRLFSALTHQEQVLIAQIEVPEDTTEVTCVAELLDAVNLHGKVVTADAAHGAAAAAYVTSKRDGNYRELCHLRSGS
jgi:hypothetical protein